MEENNEAINALQNENRKLKEQLSTIINALNDFQEAYNELANFERQNAERIESLYLVLDKTVNTYESYVKNLDYIKGSFVELWSCFENVKYELADPNNGWSDLFFPKFRSDEETLRLIIEEGKSLGRFGDGEFAIAFNIKRQKFQRLDERLANRIWEVLNSNHQNMLIGIANHYGSLDRFNAQAALGIRSYMSGETRKQHQQILPSDKIYSDAYITRPYVSFRDMFSEQPRRRFEALKKIWEGKKIVIVEGAQTRLGVGNDLFSGAAEIRRILAPSTSSFDRYDDLLSESLKQALRSDLFILAIGPSSGILAYDLTLQGYQAVDVGHIDIEYEWFLAGKGSRVPIPHKYNNEVARGDEVAPLEDPLYESQIIASFEK